MCQKDKKAYICDPNKKAPCYGRVGCIFGDSEFKDCYLTTHEEYAVLNQFGEPIESAWSISHEEPVCDGERE